MLPLITLFAIIAGLWLFLLTLDANTFKPKIESAIYDHLGIQLSIAGPLNWSINFNGLPSIALQLSDIKAYLTSTSSVQENQLFASITQLELGVALQPLLNGTLAAERLTIDGLDLMLRVDQQGHKNWHAINGKRHKPRSQLSSTANKSDNRSLNNAITDFSLKQLKLRNIQLYYQDDDKQIFHQLQISDLQASKVNFHGQGFSITAALGYRQNEQGMQPIHVQLQSELSLIGLLENSPDYPRSIAFQDFVIKLAANRQDDHSANINKPQTITLRGDGNYRINDHAFVIDDLNISNKRSAINLQLNGVPTLGHDHETPTIDITGAITASSKDLIAEARDIAYWIGRRPALKTVREIPMALSFDAVISGQLDVYSQRLSLAKLQGKLDNINIKGAISALTKPNEVTTVSSLLDIDHIDLNDYLSPPQDDKQSTITQQSNTSTTFNNVELPLSFLDQVNLLLTTHINTLMFDDIPVTNVRSGIEVNHGDVTLFQVTADAFQSTFDVDAQLTRHQKIAPILTVKSSATQLEIAALLEALDDVNKTSAEPLVSGTINIANNWSMTGNSIAEWQANLTGDSIASIQNGIFYADNIEHRVCQAIAEVRQTQLSDTWPTFTALKKSYLAIDWLNGHGKITEFTAELDTLKIAGLGSINLPTLTFMLDINGQVMGANNSFNKQKISDPACAVNAKYQNIQWPVFCQGKLDNAELTSCKINRQKLSDQFIQLAKKQAKGRVEDKLKEKLGDDFKQLFNHRLEGLFK